MADETVAVLQEIAVLLRRQVEQHDAMAQRAEEMRGRFGERPMTSKMSAGPENREEMRERAEKSRNEFLQQDREFKERLLTELERHNRLLESLLARLDR